MNGKSAHKVMLLILGGLLCMLVGLLNSPPVLLEWHYGINFGSICDPPLVILNPLRDREAENSADEFLEQLKTGKLEVLDNLNFGSERLEEIKNNESKSQIKSWFSGSREELDTKISIIYWIKRGYEGSCYSMPTNIELEKIDGVWKVVDFHPLY